MFKKDLVCVVKSGGEILRERNNGEVYLPFGSEYTLLFKNLNNRKVAVKVTIDGVNVLDDNKVIVNANDSLELEGFLKGNDATNKFKFIKRTKEIEEYRGAKEDDGIIRIEYQFEKEAMAFTWGSTWINANDYNYKLPCKIVYIDGTSGSTPLYGNTGTTSVFSCSSIPCSSNISNNVSSSISLDSAIKEEGITVKGTPTSQHFNSIRVDLENQFSVINFKLVGCDEKSEEDYVAPVFVRTKAICETCGKNCKSDEIYCSRCGTFINWNQ
jgi:hypothetical protein